MRYKEAREQSAELLRLALAEMGRHAAAFTPVSFAVWYEHVAGINPALSDAIAKLAQTEPSFSNEVIERLHAEHIAELDLSTAEQISERIKTVMKGMADAASDTGMTAGRFGDKLNALSASLKSEPEDTGRLSRSLEDALSGTTQMQAAVTRLQQRVSESQREIDTLRADLERERIDATLCPLSRVLNRKGFDRQIEAMLAEPPRPERVHALLMLDIDHFKSVNDTHGHLLGDRVIQALGEVLRASATANTSAARYGGEEFAVLMPSTTPVEGVRLAELLRARIKAMKIHNRLTNGVAVTVTVSGGIAVAVEGDDPTSLIARADAALYKSKQGGRDRISIG